MFSFSPFPVIETENLYLRALVPEDLEDLFEMRREPSIIEYTDNVLDETREETKAYMEMTAEGVSKGQWILWAMEHKETGKIIGTISIWNLNREEMRAELGYRLLPSYQKRGYMKEALLKVMDYGFSEMHLEVLEAYTEEKNRPSRRLLEGLDFKEADRVDDEGVHSQRVYHMVVYRMHSPLRK